MTIDYIFNEMSKEPNIKSQIVISFYEIYNENIFDLLQEEQNPLTILEDPIQGVVINGLVEVPGEDKMHLKEKIALGIEKRAMNSTKSNEVSSRSHAILQFTVRRYKPSSTSEVELTESKFFMIDIAGN
jgi:kinesin family protein 18/19